MNKSRQFVIIALSLITMLLSSVLAPQSLYAGKAEESDTDILVAYAGTEEDFKTLLAELAGLDVVTKNAHDDLSSPVAHRWTSKEISPHQLADWIEQTLASNVAARCRTISPQGVIKTPWGDIDVRLVIKICD